jgi:hypothetical protein
MSLPRCHIEEVPSPTVVHYEPPVVERDVVVQHPEVVHHEHHVQPVIHETERHVQPVVRTRITTEHPVSYREVVIKDPPEMATSGVISTTTSSRAVAATAPAGGMVREAPATLIVEDPPIVEKRVVHEHPQVIHHEHHIQPIIRETERHVQPIHKTEITTEHPVTYKEVLVKDPALVARPHVAQTREGAHPVSTEHHPSHATLGMKIKGTMTQLMGSLTKNEAKKERGRLLKQGVDPSAHAAVAPTTAARTEVVHQTTTGQTF